MYGSLLVHGGLLVLVLFGDAAIRPPEMPAAVRVNMVEFAPEDAPIRVDPSPPEVAEEENRPPPPEPTPDPVPQVETPTVEAEVEIEREAEPEPARAEEVGEEVRTIRIAGEASAWPEYEENIIRQIQRRWRPPVGARELRAEIYFIIHRDGRVTGFEWVARSGSLVFDVQAMGAVESAGRDQAFGPLPDDFPADALAVSFFFDPSAR
ncbi:MAG: TonB C-terminal domain-containing protein [Gemmatimonadota bacterium]|uniref:TonB C-terminal domain-containing protein n=1 Tax=Candidatus Palauibacter scopulicola TaxID=3056741 RepID=UPI00238209BD|nr:TonB C-terminal domain-containing protein [Candidatus Palauibacter scopulicola]MDE2662312.1 TonB C-terminal domain-containing protein [Candidatus Palauibacter scopulicola]